LGLCRGATPSLEKTIERGRLRKLVYEFSEPLKIASRKKTYLKKNPIGFPWG